MGTLTLAQLRTEVKAGLGNRSEFVSDTTRVDRWINQAQTRITRKSRFKELAVSESKTPSYTAVLATDKFIPFSDLTNSNPRTILSIRVIDGSSSSKLIYIPHRLWDRKVPYPEQLTTARPTHYTVYEQKIELYKIPNQAYEFIIRLTKWPTVMSTDGQFSDLSEKDDAIIAGAVYYGFSSLGNAKAATGALATYRAIIGDAIEEDRESPDFDSVGRSRSNVGISDYWSDPFQKSAP